MTTPAKPSVLVLQKRLKAEPAVRPVSNVSVRCYRDADVPRWLELRQRAFAGEPHPVRPWTEADFAAEISSRRGWCPERTWIATPADGPDQLIGSVTLIEREGVDWSTPVVHWLMVDPRWRRKGIGRLLLTTLEHDVRARGGRQIQLETHALWSAAVALYRKLGYERLNQSAGPATAG